MIPPTKCPICRQPLLNEFRVRMGKTESFGTVDVLDKGCGKSLNHSFYCYGIDRVEKIRIVVNGKTIAICPQKELLSVSNSTSELFLPYFEPDFNNFHLFLDKINLYLVFS